ncbi:MAG: DUF4139 domain-containing protein [Synergistaceae bacterium]|jgi:hypothetical protein|nr:DUF4139 domain-containing protein [Synergistaceae bacterium]
MVRRFASVLCFFVWGLAFSAAGSASASENPQFSVVSVDFYPNGAKFTFRAEADGRFAFTLPGAFDQDSVRCLTPESLTSLRVDDAWAKDPLPGELLTLKQKVSEKTRVVKNLEGRKAAFSQTVHLLGMPFPTIGPGKDGVVKIEGGELIDYISEAGELRLEAEAALTEADLKLEPAREELEDAREEYEALRQKWEARRFGDSSVLKISGTTAEPAALLFEAYTSDAGWNVRYEMNLNSATGDIEARMSATARQSTGIDVEGEFEFHSRPRDAAVTAPEVRSLLVDLRPKEEVNRYSDALMAPTAAADVMKSSGLSRSLSGPEVLSTLTDVTVRGRGRVEGDSNPTRVALGAFGLKSAPLLVVIPERHREAWVVASLDALPPAFLPGSAELAVDGAATGRARLSDSIGGRMKIPFGMTPRLTSKRERYAQKTGSTWTGTGVLDDGYTLEITSALDSEREISVYDRLPLPASDKIVLEVKKIDPEPSERDRENRLLWKMKIAPGETRRVTVEYTLRYPKEEKLDYMESGNSSMF